MPIGSLPPLGVCILPEPRLNASRTVSYPGYVHEILQHAGLCYSTVDVDALPAALPHLAVLVTVGEASFPEELQVALREWVAQGGQWISVGGACGMADLFGVSVEKAAYASFGAGGANPLGEGYLRATAPHRILEHLEIPLHFFNGTPVQATDATVLAAVLDVHGRETARAAVTEKSTGKGRCLLIAPDLPGTVVRIQQGMGVTRDGVSAPDGTAPVGDSVLKSGDGGVLDWIFDRQPVPGAPGLQAFLQPIADQWRELLLRAIFHAVESAQVILPLLWLYPRNLPALAHLSHDTDLNEPELGVRLLEVVAEAEIHSTWCVILPGYAPELMEQIKQAGHELSMHYDAMSEGCPWSHELFHQQWQDLVKLFGSEPVSNKNHYLRWEGDVELFHWCQEHGIGLDQSKGASKTGEAGYNFGTCHPYFPVDFEGRTLDVLELCTPTQDLEIFGPRALLSPLLQASLRSHGILHLLFHPAHIHKPGVADALLEAVATAKTAGMEWWTAAQINAWERARRQVRWEWHAGEGRPQISLHASAPLPDATILWSGRAEAEVTVSGERLSTEIVQRWGFNFYTATVEVEAGDTIHLHYSK
jgi:hypothetical protein